MRFELPRSFTTLLAVRLAFSIGFACLAGCSQALNDECQVNEDCSGSLVCERSTGSVRGVCQDPNKLKPAMQHDSGPSKPLPEDDAGSPPASADDAGPTGGDAG